MVLYKYLLQTGRKILKNHDVKTHLESRGTFAANDKAKLSLQTGSRDGRLADYKTLIEKGKKRREEQRREGEVRSVLGGGGVNFLRCMRNWFYKTFK